MPAAPLAGLWTSDDGRHRHLGTAVHPPQALGGAAVGWRGLCTCGWAGPLHPLTGDSAVGQAPAPGEDDDGYGSPSRKVEAGIRAEWDAHLPHPTLAAITAAAEAAREADRTLAAAVATARDAGQTWNAIGEAAGIARQSATERWGGPRRPRRPRDVDAPE
jgi:hypothetical protein